MANQLPGPGKVFLDHTAFFVPAMNAAAEALERCGFRLTAFTAQTNREGDATVPSGTGNRCAMFRNGYLELLTATSDTPLAAQLRERVADHVGLHLAAFGTADAAAEHRRLGGVGFPTLPLVDMRRPVGDDFARFTIARVAHGTMPEGRAQFLTHHTEPLVWLPDMLDHPNGAGALSALWVAATDPAEPAARYASFTGRPTHQDSAVMSIALDRGGKPRTARNLPRRFKLPVSRHPVWDRRDPAHRARRHAALSRGVKAETAAAADYAFFISSGAVPSRTAMKQAS